MPSLERAFWPLAVSFLSILGAVQIASMRQEVQTFDEGFHLAAGYSYLSQGDYRMNPEHPPLSKLLAALPLLTLKPELPLKSDAWFQRQQWEFSDEFMFRNRVDPDRMLFAARLPTVALTILLGVSVAWWTRRRFGPVAGLLALAFVAFDPNFIAHGRYVTSDVIVALFFFLSVALWIDWLESGRWQDLVGASTAFGLAQASKFSALILMPLLAFLFLIHAIRTRTWNWRKVWMGVATPCIAAILLLSGVYFRETGRIVTRKTFDSTYFNGITIVRDHNRMGHETYLLGEKRREGIWTYFPVAFLVKTPSGILLLLPVSLFLSVRRFSRNVGFVWIGLSIAAAAYFVFCMTSRINLGIRHLLPFYPLLYVLLAGAAIRLGRVRLATCAAVLVAAESLAQYPHYLAFFNLLSGGSASGPAYLVDSNIDWGQDVKKLKAYFDSIGNPPYCVEYFGTASLAHYGVAGGGVPRSDPAQIAAVDCVTAISVTLLKGLYVDPGAYQWLHEKTPIAKVGWSIYVYDLRKPKK